MCVSERSSGPVPEANVISSFDCFFVGRFVPAHVSKAYLFTCMADGMIGIRNGRSLSVYFLLVCLCL